MRKEAYRWLSESLWDLETAKILHREKRFNAAVFYAHQAAEKAIKALLYSTNQAAWGYSIRVLLTRYFETINKEPLTKLITCARELDRHYIPSRYPNAHPEGTPHEAYDEETSLRAINCGKEIVKFVKERIHREDKQ